ncbi:hypothetical protein [Singulisphaera sp. PoT]|uniref:hypothetical protein n=1 Tax=Singulisphaera sp. PoT TaxID=3411797 RepID=UPI003BF57014
MSDGAILYLLTAIGGIAALYGLHRLALRLEERGHIYYIHKKPSGGTGNGFVAMQRIIEPGVQNVHQVRDDVVCDEGAGAGSPPLIGPRNEGLD